MIRALRVSAMAVLLIPAIASAQVLNFEGIVIPPTQSAPVGNYYNGGGGPNYGISFSDNALALCLNTPAHPTCSNTSRGGYGNPTSQEGGLFFLSGSETFMNSVTGFNNGFSFFYSAVFHGGSFDVWTGLNGTGTLLASLSLALTQHGAPGCLGDFCPFEAAGVSFLGTAHSVSFAGVENQIVFDDVTFGSQIPDVTASPEPASLLLLATGLIGMAGVARHRKRIS